MTPAEKISAVAPIAVSLLPSNASALEKALLTVELAALADTDATVIAKIWNPHECPSVLLPWLAWALSVDVWDKDWSEDVKRSVIAASPIVHRLKGTVKAVKTAIQAFGLDVEVKEWHLQEPPSRRGTFELAALVKDGSLEPSPRLTEQLIASVSASKPKSRVFNLEVTYLADGGLYTAAMSSIGFTWEAFPDEFDPPEVTASQGVGASTEHFLTYEN